MKKIILLFIILIILFSGCTKKNEIKDKNANLSNFFANQNESLLSQYCFNLNENSIGIAKKEITPREFVNNSNDVKSAINGTYWAQDSGLPQGVAFTSQTGNLTTGNGRITGYLVIKDNQVTVVPDVVSVDENDLVIGTFPILSQSGVVSDQAKEERYNKYLSFRSAIGTKNGNDVCFAVSNDLITMEFWAELLVENNYKDALNLDGGGSSQLAIKGEGVFGGGSDASKIIIFSKN